MSVIKRIKEIAEKEGVKLTKLESLIGASKGVLSRALKNGTDIQSKWITQIVENYPKYNAKWLLTGEGQMLENAKPSKGIYEKESSTEHLMVADLKSKYRSIPKFDSFHFSNEKTNFEKVEERYIVPLFEGLDVDFMLSVKDISMYPKYTTGDIIACKIIEEHTFIQWNKVYVIDTFNQGVLLKRLKKSDQPEHFICKSEHSDYEEFEISLGEIRKLALVVGVIRVE